MKKILILFSFFCTFQNNAENFGGAYGEGIAGYYLSGFKPLSQYSYSNKNIDGVMEMRRDLEDGLATKAPYFCNLSLPSSKKSRNTFQWGLGVGYDYLVKSTAILGVYARYAFGASGGTARYDVEDVNRAAGMPTLANRVSGKLPIKLKRSGQCMLGFRIGLIAWNQILIYTGAGLNFSQLKMSPLGLGLPVQRKKLLNPFVSLGLDYRVSSHLLTGFAVEKDISKTVTFQKYGSNDFYIPFGKPSFKVGGTRFLFSVKYLFSPSLPSSSFSEQ